MIHNTLNNHRNIILGTFMCILSFLAHKTTGQVLHPILHASGTVMYGGTNVTMYSAGGVTSGCLYPTTANLFGAGCCGITQITFDFDRPVGHIRFTLGQIMDPGDSISVYINGKQHKFSYSEISYPFGASCGCAPASMNVLRIMPDGGLEDTAYYTSGNPPNYKTGCAMIDIKRPDIRSFSIVNVEKKTVALQEIISILIGEEMVWIIPFSFLKIRPAL